MNIWFLIILHAWLYDKSSFFGMVIWYLITPIYSYNDKLSYPAMVNWKVITTARWLYDNSSHTAVVMWYLIITFLISSLKICGYMTTHHKISMRKWKVIIIYPGTCDTYHSITIRSKKSKFYDLIIFSLESYLINHQWLLGQDLCGTPTNLSKSTAPSTGGPGTGEASCTRKGEAVRRFLVFVSLKWGWLELRMIKWAWHGG